MTAPPVTPVGPEQFSAVSSRVAAIERAAHEADGHPSLGDAVWRDLEHARPDSAGFLVDDVAYAHAARGDNATPQRWALGVTVAPAARGGAARRAALEAAIAHVRTHGGGRVDLWMLGATPGDDADLAPLGLYPDRDLYEMYAPLPVAERPKWPAGVEVRPFQPGRDEAAWVDVNNRAFAGHAEQGGWSVATLQLRMVEPWFDPTLFLLANDSDGLAGFNWMRLHDDQPDDARLGEIYVIGVDPRMQGSGLGRALAIAGLDAVHERGIETASLFCAADNTPALALYRSLGFDVHRVDRAYDGEVEPA